LAKLLRVLRAGRIVRRLEASMSMDYSKLALQSFLFSVISVCHLMACLWRMTANLQGEDVETWLHVMELDEAPAFDQYVVCLYWATMTLSTIGYGDVSVATTEERAVAITCMIFGTGFYTFIVGSVTGIVTSMNANRQDFYQRMDQLNHFVSEQRFPETLKMRLRDYFRFKNRYNNFCNHQGLLQYMSPMLRREVAVHTHMPWIRALEFFSDCCDDFVIEVAMSLTYLTYPANELVISFAEEAEAMYIINKGVVCTQGIILTAKMVFGTDMLWSNARRFYAARSLTFLNVFVLHRVNLMRILENEKFVSEKHKLYKVSVRAQFREEVLVGQSARLALRSTAILNLLRWIGKRASLTPLDRGCRRAWRFSLNCTATPVLTSPSTAAHSGRLPA
ncbi:hypothetical protein CYMTET_31566, partial [Cymbomonas tetramitiformis]